MVDALSSLFNSEDFMPHGHCFLWDPEILWLHVVSDILIGVAYFSLPVSIFYFARKRPDLPFRYIFMLFSLFIVLCGSTHFFSVWVLWNPDYGPEGLVKLMTALVSVLAAFLVWKIMPLALALPSPLQLQQLNMQLTQTNQRIEQEVVKRTGELQDANTRFVKSEKKLHQAQKMEAIGNLTGGMAHDFNNLLGIMVGNLDLLLDRLKGNPEATQLTQAALDAALSGADLTRRLLAFARQQPLQPQHIEINGLVESITKLLSRMLGEDIRVKLNLDVDIWPVIADPAQLEAALTNLATNARDAMPHGGQLIISTCNRTIDADYAAQHPEAIAGDYTVIEVSDTGLGIAPDIVSRIFEPFFTTKERGKGTGLGLSMVFGFIKQSGGHVNVYSELNKGTTFRLYLPRARNGAAIQPQTQTTRPPVAQSHETILVVEDNEGVRRVVVRQLTELGYHILEAGDAAAAVEILTTASSRVDLLFTDIVMPGQLNGLELAKLARERWPSLKVVLTSGFPETKLNGDGDMNGNLRLLSKPYRKDELAHVIHDVLAGKDS